MRCLYTHGAAPMAAASAAVPATVPAWLPAVPLPLLLIIMLPLLFILAMTIVVVLAVIIDIEVAVACRSPVQPSPVRVSTRLKRKKYHDWLTSISLNKLIAF
jgi:hypothetical protein